MKMRRMTFFERLRQKIRDEIFFKIGDCNTKDIEGILVGLGKGGEDCCKCPIFISENCKTEETEEGDEESG